MDEIAARLEAARKELLDLGLRNPLLNHRSRTKQVKVVDEVSDEIFRLLVGGSRAMTFEPLADEHFEDAETAKRLAAGQAEWAELLGQPDEETDESGLADRHKDDRLQTAMSSRKLQTRLLSIHRDARSYIEEQGVNILYLALGFLHWYETTESTEARRAPLVLVPVELERESAQERFRVAWTGDDIGDNLSLAEKLRNEFRIALPEIGDAEEFSPGEYFDKVEAALGPESRWSVERNEIVLGFFSFGKFLMYRDLDSAVWPEASSPAGHPVLGAVLGDGFSEASSPFGDDDHIDDHVSPRDTHQVLDADSSQTLAILDINAGRNMVIQGPPGTGKSQTITNIIAEAMGNGRKVLFVSEKMAALEVVKRRLDHAGLGEAALELHSHKTRKKDVLAELRRTLEQGRPRLQASPDDVSTLEHLRDHLNAYCEAVNAPIGATRVTFVEALGNTIATADPERVEPAFPFEPMREWDDAACREARLFAEGVERYLSEAGPPRENVFHLSGLTEFLPSQRPALERTLSDAVTAVAELVSSAAELATTMGLDEPGTRTEASILCRAARRAMDAPHLGGVQLSSGHWQERRDEITRLIHAGRELADLHGKYDDQVIDDAWRQDLVDVRQQYATRGAKWWRFLSSDFRRARARLQGLCRKPLPRANDRVLALVDALLDSQKHRRVYEEHRTLGRELFGAQWQRESSDWDVLEKLSEWVVRLYRDVGDGTIPGGILDFLSGSPALDQLRPRVDAVESRLREHEQSCSAAAGLLGLALADEDPAGWGMAFEEQRERLALWRSNVDALFQLVRFNRMREELNEKGLGFVADAAAGWSGGGFLRAFDHAWYNGLVETAYSGSTPIQRFDRARHEHFLAEFSRLDRLLFLHNRTRLALAHWSGLPSTGAGGEMAIVMREINKKRRHLPVRRLMGGAGNAIQAIKPIFMMSPMSIASFLPPGQVTFDLVVFDEASQVKPVDSFGALLRGTQAVVVGDTRQLPPTNFFEILAAAEEEDEELESVGDMESILSLFLGKGSPERMLRWHYRSRHESLIAVSNREFYDSRLVIFPSPGANPHARGLRFRHLPDTAYERGKSRTNPLEARAVAAAVMEHARDFPDLSLGVVAFSVAQRDAVELQLEALRRANPQFEDFFSESRKEPFFVKNLENVQGDERDVILISVGYGKTREGYLPMSFGPLNRDGGERRLNVLISRSRLAMDVFANFSADDMDLSRTNAFGVVALRNFLAYAREGRLEVAETTGREPDSPFEEAVMAALRGRGYALEAQVGTAGFFIDIGVKDADRPGRYLLGIECDGATYHSARSARDRDRLRQQVLEGLGWRIHRIWSTDWYRSPQAELERAIEAIGRARDWHAARQEAEAPAAEPAGFSIDREESPGIGTRAPARGEAYRQAELSIALGALQLHEVRPDDMARLVQQVVEVESPVHRQEVARRITAAAGLKRAGSRIQAAVSKGIDFGERAGRFRVRGDFLWATQERNPVVRNRENLDASSRKIELVAPEEIERSLVEELSESFSLGEHEAFQRAAARLGIARVTEPTRQAYAEALERALADEKITEREGVLRVC